MVVFSRGNQVNGAAMFVGTVAGGFLGQVDLAVPFVVRAGLLVVLFFLAGRLMVERGFEPRALVASQDADCVECFRIDADTGALERVGTVDAPSAADVAVV